MHYSFDFAQKSCIHRTHFNLDQFIWNAAGSVLSLVFVLEHCRVKWIFYWMKLVMLGRGQTVLFHYCISFLKIMGLEKSRYIFMQTSVVDRTKQLHDDIPNVESVERGWRKNITLSLMRTCHTKLSCNWCFGLFERLFRKAKVGCLSDIADVSKSAKGNIPVIWKWEGWWLGSISQLYKIPKKILW